MEARECNYVEAYTKYMDWNALTRNTGGRGWMVTTIIERKNTKKLSAITMQMRNLCFNKDPIEETEIATYK